MIINESGITLAEEVDGRTYDSMEAAWLQMHMYRSSERVAAEDRGVAENNGMAPVSPDSRYSRCMKHL